MTKRTKQRWSYMTGEKGRNRVRAFERASGALMIEFRDRGHRKRIAVDHRDRDQAKRQADEAAAGLARAAVAEVDGSRDLRLDKLFEMYLDEVTPKNSDRHQRYDHATADMFERYFGSVRRVATLSRRDFDKFARARAGAVIGPGGSPPRSVGPRTVQKDLSFLSSVLNWATMAGDSRGRALLDRNPMKGYNLPREKNPRRVTITDEEYATLLASSKDFDWRFHVALVLANETGHRIGAIRSLRWSDIDLEGRSIRWRAENEKTGFGHTTPLSVAAARALRFGRVHTMGIGSTPVLPATKDPSQPMGAWVIRDLWQKAIRHAGVEPKAGRGWHSLRRRFATEMMNEPLAVVCELGGWKDHETVLKCYQRPDQNDLRAALERRAGALKVPPTDTGTDTDGHLSLMK